MIVGVLAVGLVAVAPATDAFQCGSQEVCDNRPNEDPNDPNGPIDCTAEVEWSASAIGMGATVFTQHHITRSATGAPAAFSAAADGSIRYIFTYCTSVALQMHTLVEIAADTPFCLPGEGEPGRPVCNSTSRAYFNIDGEPAYNELRLVCGQGGTCHGNPIGAQDLYENGPWIDIPVPFTVSVDVRGYARATYYEDLDGDGSWFGEIYAEVIADPTVEFRIGAVAV